MAEEYQGSDYLSDNESATAKTAAAQKSAQQASEPSSSPASGAKKGGLINAVKADVTKTQGPEAAPAQTAQPATNGGGLVGAIKGSFHDGGKVPETGPYQLHKDEQVIPAKRASEYRKVFAQRGVEGKHKWGGK